MRGGPYDGVLGLYKNEALGGLESEAARNEAIRFAQAELEALGGDVHLVEADGEPALLRLHGDGPALVTADTDGARVRTIVGQSEPVLVVAFRPTDRPTEPPRATIEIRGSRLAEVIRLELVIASDLDNALAAIRAAFG